MSCTLLQQQEHLCTCLQQSLQGLIDQSPAVGLKLGLVGLALAAAVVLVLLSVQHVLAGFVALLYASAAPGGQHLQMGWRNHLPVRISN